MCLLFINGKNPDSQTIIVHDNVQYFKLKYGFHPILAAWQLDKLKLIFKMDELQIQATQINLPNSLQIIWERVGRFVSCFNKIKKKIHFEVLKANILAENLKKSYSLISYF